MNSLKARMIRNYINEDVIEVIVNKKYVALTFLGNFTKINIRNIFLREVNVLINLFNFNWSIFEK